MSQPLKVYRKTSIERRRLYLDYSCWLATDEKLTDFQVTVIPYTSEAPLSVTLSYPDAAQTKLVMFVAAGAVNTNYTLQVVIRTDAGQVKQDDLGIRVT
jgi:hypothetical protein